MQIKVSFLLVNDQDKALKFYTEVLGLEKMADLPFGNSRWLTVVSPEGAPGVELVLSATSFPPSQVYQKALYEAGIPAMGLVTQDIQADMLRLQEKGVVFRGTPQNFGPILSVLFEDTCGNLINLVQPLMR
jgi:catechol 2,3-dioxygenase-like lactoylglutathione lyase family enzyme